MPGSFELEIVTPEKVVYNGQVSSVSCPGAEGTFQILHNHAPFLSALQVGQVKVVAEDGQELFYAVSGGVSQVFQNRLLILADTAERWDEIDVARAEEAKKRAGQRIDSRNSEIDMDRAKAALYRALNRLKTAKRG